MINDTDLYFGDDSSFRGYKYSNKAIDYILDEDWVTNTFMVKSDNLEELDSKNRYWSSADIKFVDTSFGGHLAINPLPQPSRFTDMRLKGRRLGTSKVFSGGDDVDVGMGRWYSEAIDDNSQLLFLSMGVESFNNPFTWLTRSVDYATSIRASTGRTALAYGVGKVTGAIAMAVAFPFLSVAVYGFKLIKSLLTTQENFSYYYMKPDMTMFWETTSKIASAFAVERGFVIPQLMESRADAKRIGLPVAPSKEIMDDVRQMMPGVFSKNNYLDMFALCSKPQRLANNQALLERKLFEEGKLSKDDFLGYVKTNVSKQEKDSPGAGYLNMLNELLMIKDVPTDKGKVTSLEELIKESRGPKSKEAYGPKPKNKAKVDETATTNVPLANEEQKIKSKFDKNGTYEKTDSEVDEEGFFSSMFNSVDSSFRGGGAWVVFRVKYDGSNERTFTNSLTEIPLSSTIKEVNRKSRVAKFSFGGGKIIPGLSEVVDTVKDVAVGVLDGVTFNLASTVASIFGNSYVHMPQMWDDSEVSVNQHNFKIELRSPYDTPISNLKNYDIPISALLATVLPKGTGKVGYTSPFLCAPFLKGRIDSNLSIVSSMSITPGVSDLSHDSLGRPIGFDINFTITELDTIPTAPVNSGFLDQFSFDLDDANSLNRYISTICARDLKTRTYALPKARLKFSRLVTSYEGLTSPNAIGFKTGNFMNGIAGGLVSSTSLNLLDSN